MRLSCIINLNVLHKIKKYDILIIDHIESHIYKDNQSTRT